MNLQGNVSSSPSDDSNAAFTFAGENLTNSGTENCFTDALQQLHDQQENVAIVNTNTTTRKQSRKKRHHVEDEMVTINNKNNNNNNNTTNHNHNNRSTSIQSNNNSNSNDNSFNQNVINCNQAQMGSRPPVGMHIPTNNALVNMGGHVMSQEQFMMNNMAVLGNSNHQVMPHQMQQEIAFLNQAMGFVPERDGMQQALMDHVTMADPAMQFRHMHPRFQENNFVEAPFTEHAQMHVAGMDPVSVLSHLDEQNKMYVENNPHYQPIDLELQEMVKRERKKLRNRVASSKCRKRKLEREARLDLRVKDLKEKNIELGAVANALKQQVCDLKQRVMDHVGEGCQIVLSV